MTKLVSVKIAANMLSVSERTIYNMIKLGEIEIAAKFGSQRQSRVRIAETSITDFQKNYKPKA